MIELAQHESYWRGVDCLYVWETGHDEPVRAVWDEGYDLYGFAVLDRFRICTLSSLGWQVTDFETQTEWKSTGYEPAQGRGIVASRDGTLVGYHAIIHEGETAEPCLDLFAPGTGKTKRIGPISDCDGPFPYGARGLGIYTLGKNTISHRVFYAEDFAEDIEYRHSFPRPDGAVAVTAASPEGTIMTDAMFKRCGGPLAKDARFRFRPQGRWIWRDANHFYHVNTEEGRANIWLRRVKGEEISPPLWHGVFSTEDGPYTYGAELGHLPDSAGVFLRYGHKVFAFEPPRLKRWPSARTAAEPEPLRIRRTFAMPAPDNPHEGVRRSVGFGFFPPAEVKT